MKKRKKPNNNERIIIQNPVAKFAAQFNKAHIFCDKNHYRRNPKHRKQEASPIALINRVIGEVSCGVLVYIRQNCNFGTSEITPFVTH